MNLTEYLLICLVEECSEVQKRAAKALRFTLAEKQHGQPHNNAKRLLFEIRDLQITLAMLQEAEPSLYSSEIESSSELDDMVRKTCREIKWQKMRRFMQLSRDMGVLDDGQPKSATPDAPRCVHGNFLDECLECWHDKNPGPAIVGYPQRELKLDSLEPQGEEAKASELSEVRKVCPHGFKIDESCPKCDTVF